ncbi:MAG: hypothetical protein OXQ86_04820 [Gammaproteobacteria bacterium]|nr:hypothetical protein [Gammaproteobacteria bacterium]MDE0413498.1 hypothetical protein [Gammaproteobacteria bacterium]
MSSNDTDILMRLAAFKRVEMLSKMHGHLTHRELSTGFTFQDERIPLVNPQRGIFKPRQMRYLLSIKTVIPKPGGRVWYDDQLEAHDQIYDGDDGIDYAFMGSDPNAADNQWLRAAYENQVGVIYFLGIAPGRYQAIWPVYITGWYAMCGALPTSIHNILDRAGGRVANNRDEKRRNTPDCRASLTGGFILDFRLTPLLILYRAAHIAASII